MKMKNIICVILALGMCLALCACGGEGDTDSGTRSAVHETPEFVYTAEYTELLKDTDKYLSPMKYTEDGIYVSSWEKTGEGEIPEGEVPEYEGQYDICNSFIYFIDNSGKMTKLENYQCTPADENTDGMKDFSSSSSLSGSCWTDGGFVTLESVYTSWYEGEEEVEIYSEDYWKNQKYEQKYYLRWFDLDGNEKSCVPIKAEQDEWFDSSSMKLDGKGNVVISFGQGVEGIAPDGSVSYRIDTDDYIDGIVSFNDGSIGVVVYGDQQELWMLDEENGELTDPKPVDFDVYFTYSGNDEYDLYYTNGTNFYGYDVDSDTKTTLFNWISCDVNGSNVMVLDVSEDGVVSGLIYDRDSGTQQYDYELVRVSKVPYDSVPHKQTLTMAVMYLDYNVQDMVVDYNRTNEEYRIEIIDYSEYNNEKDGDDAGVTKLNTELVSGEVPDIICLSGLNYTQLAAKGILEDLYPFIDSDKELDREDFFSNVLTAMEVNGKLCGTVSGFYITSAIGAASVVGDEPGWSYDEFNAALASMPEGCTAFDQYVTRSKILQTCLALDMGDFVDWSTGSCNFDSEQFVKLLSFAESFPAEVDWENYDYSTEESTEDRLASGKQMLVQTSAYSIQDIFYNNYTQFLGGRITYIGYPTENGTGNMITLAENGYAMGSRCEHKDAVWAFLRQFFTEDYQKTLYSLPSRTDVFEAQAEEAMTVQYQKNSEGEYLLDSDGERVPIVQTYMWNKDTKENEEIYCLTAEQVDQIRQLVKTTTKVADYNDEIISIVSEQATPFFEGQKSAEEVAKLIQSKVNIYVNEQR